MPEERVGVRPILAFVGPHAIDDLAHHLWGPVVLRPLAGVEALEVERGRAVSRDAGQYALPDEVVDHGEREDISGGRVLAPTTQRECVEF